ncbi:MAG TPA: DUF1559 domain-containing protein [Gemmataceae bacterium]|nr:DUF1559 domain-containing protein [Gemmataceae bacterium]
MRRVFPPVGSSEPGARAGRAFTLIELLVVIAITAILIGLLLPAVQKVREAAARSTCSNNLKQLSLAVHNYEGTNGKLPPMSVTLGNGSGVPGSIMVALMPYVEQDNLYKQHQANNGVTQAVGQSVVKTYLCPSDPNASNGQLTVTVAGTPGTWATCSYNANAGMFSTPNSSSYPDQASWNWTLPKFATLVSITDGTSNTVGFTERIVNAEGYNVPRDVSPLAANDAYKWGSPSFGNYQTQYPGGGWGTWPFIQPQIGKTTGLVRWAPSSAHSGVILCGLMDGSVRPVGPGVSAATFWLACRPDDGNPMPSDWN